MKPALQDGNDQQAPETAPGQPRVAPSEMGQLVSNHPSQRFLRQGRDGQAAQHQDLLPVLLFVNMGNRVRRQPNGIRT